MIMSEIRGLPGKYKRQMGNAATNREQGFTEALASYTPARDKYQPYMDMGAESASAVQKLFGDPSSIKGLPSYKFRYEEGQKGVENIAGSKGKLFSGQTLQELVRYGQEFASNEYDKEIARRMPVISAGLTATKGYDEASFNLADLQAGKGQAFAQRYEDQAKYTWANMKYDAEMLSSWFSGSGPFGGATSKGVGS